MKLIRAYQQEFTFGIGRREKQLLFQMLQLYPLVPPAHHRLSQSGEGPAHDENQRLLEESLAEQRRENRREVQAMLSEPARFRETKEGLRFTLTGSEMEWLLQVLNDVRIGAWLALGEPEELELPEVTRTNAPYLLALESAGYFESALLDALGGKNPPRPRH
ncbi:MAG: hypothetical protein KIS67_22435 [Verrucomicrobiae bacterium]|nr:hypothetical protein [Verrucomicrobiae bacterium]